MSSPAGPPLPQGKAIYLAIVQFLFVSCWTIYVDLSARDARGVGIAAALALATIARMAAVAGELNQVPDLLPALSLAPFVLWFAGAAVFAALARQAPRPAVQ